MKILIESMLMRIPPCFEHHRYTGNFINGKSEYYLGIELRPDSGGRLINWPAQNYENGVWKNKETGNRFSKSFVFLNG